MSDEQRLHQEITKLQEQWDLLSEKLSELEQEKIVETRVEEKFRLEHKIKKTQAERQEVEQQLHDLEAQVLTETKKGSKNGSVAQDVDQDKKRTQKREKRKAVNAFLLLLLPTFGVAAIVLTLMYWRIPARVEVELTVNRAVFTVDGDASTAILNAPVRFQSITIEKFAGIKLRPEQLEVANPAQYIPTDDRYPEDAWTLLTITPPVVISGKDETLQPAVTLESIEAESAGSGMLDLIHVKPGAEVILELRSERVEDLTIQVEGQESFATVSLPGVFQLITDYGRVSGIIDLPYQEEDFLTYRAQLPDETPLIEVNSQSDSLGLFLTVSPEELKAFFYQGGIPVTSLEFIRQGLKGEIETTLIKGIEGYISYPEYPGIEKVSFQSPDFLGLDKLEKFRIEEITLNRQNGGIQFRLNGVAGHIRSGSRDFPKDHRLTRFDALWQNPRLMILFSIIVWVFPTTLGGYKLYKELSEGKKSQP